MSNGDFRFGVIDIPYEPYTELVKRWQLVEDLGFDYLFTPDHAAGMDDIAEPLGDGWVTLAAMAVHTQRVRIGTMVCNPIIRHPAIIAKQAAAIDDLSQGRLELGIGTGVMPNDHEAVGEAYWDWPERRARFVEAIAIVDELLRGNETNFAGEYYKSHTRTCPGPVQSPRPPITVGGQHRVMLETAARYADRWNTHGPIGASLEDVLQKTEKQMAAVDRMCEQAGRDPAALKRSIICVESLDCWGSDDALNRLVEQFSALGVREFILPWPGDAGMVERAAQVMNQWKQA